MKVLIIENDRPSLEALTKLIARIWKIDSVELNIVGCSTLEEGLRESADANVTILDLNLPDSDLTETIQAIRRFPPPVIVLTGYDSPDVTASCMAHGAAHVFHKGTAIAIGLIPSLFEAMQRDVVRRATERHEETGAR